MRDTCMEAKLIADIVERIFPFLRFLIYHHTMHFLNNYNRTIRLEIMLHKNIKQQKKITSTNYLKTVLIPWNANSLFISLYGPLCTIIRPHYYLTHLVAYFRYFNIVGRLVMAFDQIGAARSLFIQFNSLAANPINIYCFCCVHR